MRVAGLKAISTVVDTSMILIKSRHATHPELIKQITSRIKGWIGKVITLPMFLKFKCHVL